MRKISTDKVAKSDKILSQAIESNGLVFVSGQIHAGEDWQFIQGSAKEKFAVCMRNIETILHEASSSLDRIVKLTVYTTDMSLIPEINEEYAGYFSDILPAREAIGVSSLPLGADIEVVVVAEVGNE